MSKVVRVGIVGAGGAGGYIHATAAKKLPGLYEVVAWCDLKPEALAKRQAEYGGDVYTDLAEMLARDDIDLCAIVTRPHATHASLAIQCMEAGKGVLVEKPMAATVDEARRMIATSQRTGSFMTVHHNRRFNYDVLALRDALAQGVVGQVRHIEQHRTFGYKPGDVMMEWGSHCLDMGVYVAGDRPTEVMAIMGYPENEILQAGYFRAEIRFAGGLQMTVSLTPHCGPSPSKIWWKAVGTEGVFFQDWAEVHSDFLGRLQHYDGEHKKPTDRVFDITVRGQGEPNENAFLLYYRRLHKTLTENVPPLVSHQELLWQIQLMHAIHASARTGKTVAIEA